jgi:hypothetical protein
MDFEKAFGADEGLMAGGVDVRFGPDCFITLRHAGASNRAYQAALTERVQRNWAAFTGHDRLAQQELIAQEVFAEQIVIGWRGVEVKGEPLEFSKDNALKLFRAYPVVWERVQLEAGRLSNFQKEALGSAGK